MNRQTRRYLKGILEESKDTQVSTFVNRVKYNFMKGDIESLKAGGKTITNRDILTEIKQFIHDAD